MMTESIASGPNDMALAALEKEFGWPCWHDGDQYYACRPHTPHGEHDARGDDPADLREAITLALPQELAPTRHEIPVSVPR
jgi:hypothetical protein